ncbi:helix-turn-helix transcriptional regulator [Micromonospora sp. NPDC049559]|uniref:helix-turn-helix transcriptional regulator n=1 Tax=Micromonospora sp. NPDC049559 TaxID=3155923 RepID=UPI003439837A
MINYSKWVTMLSQLGLSLQTEMVYRALLFNPQLSAADLMARLRISERVTRKSLRVLVDLGLVLMDDTSGQLTAVSPGTGLRALLGHIEQDVRQRQMQADATRRQIDYLAKQSDWLQQEPTGVVRLGDAKTTRNRVGELLQNARQEYFATIPFDTHTPWLAEETFNLANQLSGRGVRLKSLYQRMHHGRSGLDEIATRLVNLGSEVRTGPKPPVGMVLVDREVVLLSDRPGDSTPSVIEVRNAGLIAAMYALFEQLWQAARPVTETRAETRDKLTPQEAQILGMLADGSTDEIVARHLGVSVRTVRRNIAQLTERLRASSRFQAGAQAVRAGWL